MTQPIFSTNSKNAITLHLVAKDDLQDWLSERLSQIRSWVQAMGFTGAQGEICVIPDGDKIGAVLIGLGTEKTRKRIRFSMVEHYNKLPEGVYKLSDGTLSQSIKEEFSLGWLLAQYRYDLYAKQPQAKAALICPEGVDAKHLQAMATGEYLTRDLINTPSSDMGPDELEASTQALAQYHGAKIKVVKGDDLLDQNFPMIHAVGRASDRTPRLIDMTWGTTGPTVTLVGKGVCFDTGGLNIKPASSMGLMKKDMGGAAHVLGLAHMIMISKMPIKLRVLIPAVENSISSNAFRPQDILNSRKGLTVEINNTDAEGRLVLADALALADETPADLLICMATLTGAARVAVGPDITPYYTDDIEISHSLETAAKTTFDPIWRMPFHDAYEPMIEPGIADLDNAPAGSFAGSITAALFLRRFVTNTDRFVHFDCYGWQPNAAPARTKGGLGQGIRAIFKALPEMIDL